MAKPIAPKDNQANIGNANKGTPGTSTTRRKATAASNCSRRLQKRVIKNHANDDM